MQRLHRRSDTHAAVAAGGASASEGLKLVFELGLVDERSVALGAGGDAVDESDLLVVEFVRRDVHC